MQMSFDEYALMICEDLAKRSPCLRRKNGALIVNARNEIIGTGYNGPPRGVAHCTICFRRGVPSGKLCNDNCMAVHAELNALLQTTRRDFGPFIMYTVYSPCFVCIKAAINFGVSKIIFTEEYPHDDWTYKKFDGIVEVVKHED